GIETMFRTSLRNHIQLSQIADNKANIMLTINGGILAFSLGSLFPRFEKLSLLVLPTCILVAVCVTALIFAVISTIPKVTRGEYTREEIQDKRANLLFFGNFYKMSLQDFEWGINEVIKDRDYLYSSMIRDFYSLGKVLSVKYKYLRVSYMIFMIGMIISVLAFTAAFLFKISL
ncbi:MAG: HD family phosphohydrolase, partial [bacterium]|nr:HD family phosphohydrolase [bacterium]